MLQACQCCHLAACSIAYLLAIILYFQGAQLDDLFETACQDHLRSVEAECSALEGYIVAFVGWRAAHQRMVERHLSKVSMRELELNLKLRMGETLFTGSQEHKAVIKTSELLAAVSLGKLLSELEWQSLEEGLILLATKVWPNR